MTVSPTESLERSPLLGQASPLINSDFFESQEETIVNLRNSYLIISEKNAGIRNKDSTGPGATFIHILKANIGIALLSMPNAMQNSGYVLGPTVLILMGLVAIHCMTLIVTCSHHLCKQLQLPALGYADVAELAVTYKFKKRRLGVVARIMVNSMLILTQLGFCCTYISFISQNINLLFQNSGITTVNFRIIIVVILPMFILGSYIRSLKFLAPLSFLANLCYLYSIIVILVFCFLTIYRQEGIGPDVHSFSPVLLNYPLYFGNIIFAFEGIGSVLPLENKISKPNLFQPILWTGMFIVMTSYVILGMVGYFTFGSNLAEIISFNLPKVIRSPLDLVYPVATLFLSFGIFCTYFLQFYVPMEIIEPIFLYRINSSKLKLFGQIIIRTILVIFTALVAIAIAEINLLIDFIGACSSSSLALIFPPALEIITFWGARRYRLPFYVWVVKDIIILSIGLIGGAIGTGVAIFNIAESFSGNDL